MPLPITQQDAASFGLADYPLPQIVPMHSDF
jgi:hypothetical protein